tara:strand:+ start:2446 stop:3423 length:978 start_codon:yes stop_codon:yes gene_type:complete
MASKKENEFTINSKCPCGSGVKFKNCCKPYPRKGPLIKEAPRNFNDIHTTFLFEINGILQNLCIETENLNKLYESLLDLFSLSERAIEDYKKHTFDLKGSIGVTKNNNTWQVKDFDHICSFYTRHLFVDGDIVKDALCKLSRDLGFNIEFLFGKDDHKKFETKLSNLSSKFTDKNEARRLEEFIQKNKKEWLTEFIKARNDVEHGIFKTDPVEYHTNKFEKLIPYFPLILKKNAADAFKFYPVKLFYFSKEIIIFLLGEVASKEKFPGGLRGVLVQTVEDKMPWGDLNKEKKMFKMTIMEESTGNVHTSNFSRSCPKRSKKDLET